ncbi:MAG: thymidylate synthase [bacterium]
MNYFQAPFSWRLKMRNIPVIIEKGKTLADAYEKALMSLWDRGCRFKTQYDKPEDSESIDATMNITVEEPFSDPMIHKAFPGGINDLREYVMELQGYKDHWIKNIDDPRDTRWSYTYHGRFKNYGAYKKKLNKKSKGHPLWPNAQDGIKVGTNIVNQIEIVIQKLIEQPFTRQAQLITWMPYLDLYDCHSPCLQSIWLRMAEDDGVYWLNYNIRIRSNDAWGAYFMNSFGITMFVKEIIADEISKRTGKEVKLARMNWQADSWHIYGKDIKSFKEMFINRVPFHEEERIETFPNRIYNFSDEIVREIYNESTSIVKAKITQQDQKYIQKNKQDEFPFMEMCQKF